MPSAIDSLPQVDAPTRRRWRAWLEKHHAKSPGAWLIFYKKSAGHDRLPYGDAVEEALCFGWVDSLTRRLDDDRYIQLFTPRKPRSGWSKPNKERVARLIESGLMTPAGLAKIEAARRDGSWNALDIAESLEPPADLVAALRRSARARKTFDGYTKSARKAVLAWITSAKRPETRAARIAKTVHMADKGLHPLIDRE